MIQIIDIKKIYVRFYLFLILVNWSFMIAGETFHSREENIKNFLKSYLDIELTEEKDNIKFYDAFIEKGILGDKARFRCFFSLNKLLLVTNEDGSEIYQFINMREKNNLDENKNITIEEAFNKIRKLLTFYKLPEEKSQYSIRTEDNHICVRSHNLNINNIPCRGTGFYCLISQRNGDIKNFFYKPLYPPVNKKTPDKNFEENLIKIFNNIVTSWLSSQDYFENRSYRILEKPPLLVIAPNVNLFVSNPSQELLKGIKYFYAWEVEIEITENAGNYEGVIWIDTESHKVIGATGKQIFWLY